MTNENTNPDDRRSYTDLENKIDSLEDKVAGMEVKIDTLTSSVEDLVLAWNTAKGITGFVKWLAGISTALGVLYALFHGTPKG